MGYLLSCRDCLVAVERYKIWDISCHAGTALWLWRGIRYGTSPVMQGLPCGCGEVQDMGHLLSCKDCPQKCTLEDLWLANKKGFDVAQYWAQNL
jgi:hypothetical protein